MSFPKQKIVGCALKKKKDFLQFFQTNDTIFFFKKKNTMIQKYTIFFICIAVHQTLALTLTKQPPASTILSFGHCLSANVKDDCIDDCACTWCASQSTCYNHFPVQNCSDAILVKNLFPQRCATKKDSDVAIIIAVVAFILFVSIALGFMAFVKCCRGVSPYYYQV